MQSVEHVARDIERYVDRRSAGRRLARLLANYAGRRDVVVLALSRGGVPVGFEVARELGAPLDVLVVRKLGFPGHPELAMGAVASGGASVLNEDLVRRSGISDEDVTRVAARELQEIARRELVYRGVRPPLDLRDRVAIVVDDGLATGATMRVAVVALRGRDPTRIVVAVPVAAYDSAEEMRDVADDVICELTPERLRAVGFWYDEFGQVTDEEVRTLLDRSFRAGP
jgi:predicted phosphoribosyltransferase